ncbi:non-homologous end joining protein Ku [Streptomyces mirabilis]
MPAIWSGTISFGLVSIPVRVLAATEDRSVRFRLYHLDDLARVRVKKVCEVDEQIVTGSEIGRGYEMPDGRVIPVSDEELDSMPVPTARAIEIVGFVPETTIDPVQLGTNYYLAADGPVAAKPYTLIREALKRSSKVAVARFAMRNRERLGLLRVYGDALVLTPMRWPDEVRDPAELTPGEAELSQEEIQAAVDLMESMTTEDLSGFSDHYREALEEVIRAKAEGKRPPKASGEEAPARQVVDLMAALKESVRKAQQSRGEDATVHEMPQLSAAKRPTATKAAAKKTSGRKPHRSA